MEKRGGRSPVCISTCTLGGSGGMHGGEFKDCLLLAHSQGLCSEWRIFNLEVIVSKGGGGGGRDLIKGHLTPPPLK